MNSKRFFDRIANFFLVLAILMLILLITFISVKRVIFIKIVKTTGIITISFLILILVSNRIRQISEERRIKEQEEEREQINELLSRVQIKMKDDIEIYEGPVEQKIQQTDKNFQKEEFDEFAKMLFMKIHQSFNKRDYSELRIFESRELFEQHKIQIQNYIASKTINIKDRINVLFAKIYNFKQTVDREILIVILKASLIEYVIDEDSEKILNGNNKEKTQYYKMEFIRKKGVKTQDSVNHLKTINCPNCGGISKIIFAGECPYCGSMIIEGKHNWILNGLELLKEI